MTMAASESGRFGTAFEWLGVERAWTRTRGSPDVLIAILDEIADPDRGPGTDDPLDAPARTETTSTIAPRARILRVPFAREGTHALDLPHAIEYAVEMGACIINLPVAEHLPLPAAQRALEYAATRNALVVSPADGNQSATQDVAPNVVRVLAVGQDCRPLSNYHGRARNPSASHLAAPGFARVARRLGEQAELGGEGLAAPYVSGCAALVKTLNPGWGYHEIREHLLASGTPRETLAGHCAGGQLLSVANAVLGPIDHADDARTLAWPSLSETLLHWQLRYRSALCVNVVALYRPHGDEHWRELGSARAITQKMTIPAEALRRSSGTLRLACRESNFHADDLELTIF